jgi:glyoxylase-like metal-dependent hydrolase (beta-lactamase superfamily II)
MAAALTDVGGGTVRVTLPLPWALDHVHCYAVPGPEGWTIVDTGLGDEPALAAWEDVLARLGSPRVRRLVVTHYHPDHLGGGDALVRLTGAEEVVQGSLDAALAERAWGRPDSVDEFRRHLELHGMPSSLAARSAAAEESLPVRMAQPTRLVEGGDELEMGGERWSVHVLPGHADGHIALHGQSSGRLLGGDVLLADITPNVGRWPDTAPDPLGSYLSSLGAVDAMAPARVLPGHGPLITDAVRRTAEIRAHHAERLDLHLAALRQGAETAFEAAQVVWATDGLGLHEQRFALVEALAHLERLEAEGRARQRARGRWAAVHLTPPL